METENHSITNSTKDKYGIEILSITNTKKVWNVPYFVTNVSFGSFTITNPAYQFEFQPKSYNGEIITNVIIKPDYKGTIQVGTNFYRLVDVTNFYTTKELKK